MRIFHIGVIELVSLTLTMPTMMTHLSHLDINIVSVGYDLLRVDLS